MMDFFQKPAVFLLMLGFFMVTVAGCAGTEANTGTDRTLKLGVLSLEDILPMVVANEKGYFAQEEIIVELIPFQSAIESQSAIQSGQVDGMMTDMIVAALLKDTGTDLRITSITLEATPERRRFAIVVPPESQITRIEELRGKELGISFNSIIEYVSDELLNEVGLEPEEIKKVAIPKIPVRLEMLLNNKIEAATLPDPLITFAEFNGCKVIIDDRNRQISQAVLVMTGKTLSEKEGVLEDFYRAYTKSVKEINANSQDYKEIMANQISIPEPIMEQYRVPIFPEPKLPAEEEVGKVLNWLKEKGVIAQGFAYDDFVEKGLY